MSETDPRRLVETVMALPGFARSSGMTIENVAPGQVALALARRADLLQFGGNFHGGVITALADQAAGAAVSTTLPAGKIGVTVEIKINFLASASGDDIVARAETLRTGGGIGVAKIEVFTRSSQSETLCAFGTATMRAVDKPIGLP
jgi:uncharacterized protein (TIGR00369 family)